MAHAVQTGAGAAAGGGHAVQRVQHRRDLEANAHSARLKIIAVGKYFFQLARRGRHVILRLRARMRPIIGAAVKEVGLHIA